MSTDLPIAVRSATSEDVPAIASLTAQVQELHARSYPALFKTNVPPSELEDAARQYLSDDSQRVLVAVRAGVDVFVRNTDARRFYESRGFTVEREVRWFISLDQRETDAPVL